MLQIESLKNYYGNAGINAQAILPDGGIIFYIKSRGEKPQYGVESISSSSECSFCNGFEELPVEIPYDRWTFAVNKFSGSDRELLLLSNNHDAYIDESDIAELMRISSLTSGITVYSPSQKSIPQHKHANLFFHPESLLFDAINSSGIPIKNGINLFNIYGVNAIHIEYSDHSFRELSTLLSHFTVDGLMYNLYFANGDCILQPFPKDSKVLGNRLSLGLSSTSDYGQYREIVEGRVNMKSRTYGSFSLDYLANVVMSCNSEIGAVEAYIRGLMGDKTTINLQSTIFAIPFGLTHEMGLIFPDLNFRGVNYLTDKLDNFISFIKVDSPNYSLINLTNLQNILII